jgi:hypothetical protein
MGNFTVESIGIDVQATYQGSKGASLEEFFLKGDEAKVIKLTRNLVEYMDTALRDKNVFIDGRVKQFEQIKEIASMTISPTLTGLAKIDFSDLNNDEYLEELMDELNTNIETNPATVIGQAKDLLEAVYKRILEHYKITYSKKADMTKLLSQVNEVLRLSPNLQNKKEAIGEISAKILGNLNQVVSGLDELRNNFGRGHGRGSTQAGAIIIPRRYANLAVSSTCALINFLTETVKRVDKRN